MEVHGGDPDLLLTYHSAVCPGNRTPVVGEAPAGGTPTQTRRPSVSVQVQIPGISCRVVEDVGRKPSGALEPRQSNSR